MIAEPVTEPTTTTLEATPAAVVRHQGVTVADVPNLFDAGYTAIATSGAQLAGPAFALYLGDPIDRFDLELGFPVAEPLPAPIDGTVTVEPSTLPSGDALALSHIGPYDALAQTWGRLAQEAAKRGVEPKGWLEVYVTEPTPETDPATLRTDLYLLL